VVTGATGELGRATASLLGERGARLGLVARGAERLEALATGLAARGVDVDVLSIDVTAREAAETIARRWPATDVLVNVAGTNQPEPFVDVAAETYERLFDLNVRATFAVSQAVVRRMLADGRGGVVVSVTSQMGHVGAVNRSVYCATKHAVEGLSRAMAVELAPHGIRVCTVAPTFVRTAMTEAYLADPETRSYILGSIPAGRLATAQEVAAAVAFAASPHAGSVTGTSIVVDGGWTAQ
jgi:NAD(P)-dependent dehydrogenase (short-subunit alcohol dehydrogenase family)